MTHFTTLYKSFKLINNAGNILKSQRSLPLCNCISQTFYSSTTLSDNAEEKKKKPKTALIPKITLISGDNINVTTLDEAQRLSKRRDLKLVKIIDLDSKTHRPVYKLMTGAQYHEEDLKQREQRKKDKQAAFIKGEKVLMLTANIAKHDLDIDIKKISKWISKNYEVRVVISGDLNKADQIYANLELALKSECRIVQKRQKGNDIRFQILPPKRDKPDDDQQNL